MHSIPMERFAGARIATGVFGLPTLHLHLSTRAKLGIALALVVGALQLLGVIDIFQGGLVLGAGTLAPVVPTDRSAKLRTQWREHITQARAILDASPTPKLSQEDQNRYDDLFAKAGEFRAAAEQDEALAAQERSIASPLSAPEHPVVRSTPVAGGDDVVGGDIEMSPARRLRQSDAYAKAFRRFLRGLDPRGDSKLLAEARALQMDSDTAGGFTVAPEQFMATLIKAVDDVTHIRQRATVHTLETSASLGVPSLAADPDDFDWTTELATGSEDSTMAFGKREFKPNPLAKRIKISKKLLRASALDVDGIVTSRLAYKLGITQEKAYLTGSGAGRPLGVFVASNDGVPTSRDVTAAATTTFVGDDLQNVVYSLKPQYRANKASTAWMFHRDGVKVAAKLKDGEGRYLLQLGLSTEIADTILGFPFMESEYAPSTFTTGLYVGMLADWSWYWIVDALDMQIQRLVELYAESNQDGLIARYEGDGMPVLPEAFARLKLA